MVYTIQTMKIDNTLQLQTKILIVSTEQKMLTCKGFYGECFRWVSGFLFLISETHLVLIKL